MAWRLPCHPAVVALAGLSLVTVLVPASLAAPSPGPVATPAPSAQAEAEPGSLDWQPAEASPAAAVGWGIGATPSMAILSTDGDGTFVSQDGAVTWAPVDAGGVTAGTVAEDPSDPDVAYVGGFGGLAATTDGGESLELLLEAHNVRGLDVAPDGTVVAGVANDDFELDVLVSEDRGQTWTDVGWPSDRYTVQGIAFGQSADNVAVTAFDETWVTQDGGDTWDHEDAGGRTLDGDGEGTLWRSGFGTLEASTDGGQTWTEVDAPDAPSTLTGRPGGGIFGVTSVGLLATEDGETWTNLGHSEIVRFATQLTPDPDRDEAVLMSHEELGAAWVGPAGSSDGYAVEGRTGGLPTVDVTAVGVSSDGGTVLAGSSQGVYGALDGSEAFLHLGAGLGVASVDAVAAGNGGQVLYAGGQNMIFSAYLQASDDGGETWRTVLPTADDSATREIVVDPADPERAWALVWVEIGPDKVYETQDAGRTWTPIAEAPHVDVPIFGAQGPELTGMAHDGTGGELMISSTGGVLEHDLETGGTGLAGVNPAEDVATAAAGGYADGPVQSLWAERGDPTGQDAVMLPWADTSEEVAEVEAVHRSADNVVLRGPDGGLHHCVPGGDGGACEEADLPEGDASALAGAGGSGTLWAGTPAQGLFQASAG